MYCWMREYGRRAITQVRPSRRESRTVFRMVLMILLLELMFLTTTTKISKSGQFLSLHLRLPALYAVQTALMVTARLRTKTRPGGEIILDKVMKYSSKVWL